MSTPQMMKCGCAATSVVKMIKGVACDPIPACPVHDCYEVADTVPDLTGRMAECAYWPKGHAPKPSSLDLAFFEYLGAGSREATNLCKCGYAKVAHDNGRVKCKSFTPKGAADRDRYYCGCHGWD